MAKVGAIGIPTSTALALGLVFVVGFLVRIGAALSLPVFVDEPHSLLGVLAAAEHGVPRLPSGVLYLHGATLSYLAAPLAWLGLGDLANLHLLRMASVVAGSIVIFLTYRVALEIGAARMTALLAAGLIALDPISIVWSGHFRMYALLQALVMVVVWMFLRLARPAAHLNQGSQRGVLVGLVVAFWLAIFTQIVAAALWPALALVAVLLYGRALFGARRDIAVGLGLCLLAPLVFVAASSVFGAGAGTARLDETDVLPAASFIGNHTLGLDNILHPDFQVWQGLFATDLLKQVAPLIVVGLSAILISRYRPASPDRDAQDDRAGIVSVILLFWVPLLGIIFLSSATQSRYLIFLQPLCCILVAAAIASLPRRRHWVVNRARWTPRESWVTLGVTLLVALYLGVGLHGIADWGTRVAPGTLAANGDGVCSIPSMEHERGQRRSRLPKASPDCFVKVAQSQYSAYVPALHYVAGRHAPGEPILVALPAVAYLTLGDREELRFLAGAEGSQRTARYTRPNADGTRDDYWIGMGAIASVAELCESLRSHPDGWVVLDEGRRRSRSTFGGAMRPVIDGAADVVFSVDGAMVLRPTGYIHWDRRATKQCQAHGV